jgi:ribosomal protein L24
MVDQACRLIRATAAVARGVSRQVCKVLPEDSVIVVEGTSDDGKTVNVRCGTEKLWMFARDVMDRSSGLIRPERPIEPGNLKLISAPAKDDETLVKAGLLHDGA